MGYVREGLCLYPTAFTEAVIFSCSYGTYNTPIKRPFQEKTVIQLYVFEFPVMKTD